MPAEAKRGIYHVTRVFEAVPSRTTVNAQTSQQDEHFLRALQGVRCGSGGEAGRYHWRHDLLQHLL